jgi:hypothetical protein
MGTAPPLQGHTSVHACYNRTHLVVTFDCADTDVNSSFPRGCYAEGGRGDPRCPGGSCSQRVFQQSSTELFIAKGLSGTTPPGRNWELDLGARGAMYINQNQSPGGTCDGGQQRPDIYPGCDTTNQSSATGMTWDTKIDPLFGWHATYALPFSWLGRDNHYRANFHRNGPAAYQSSWSNARNQTRWKSFHCPYLFGVLLLKTDDNDGLADLKNDDHGVIAARVEHLAQNLRPLQWKIDDARRSPAPGWALKTGKI